MDQIPDTNPIMNDVAAIQLQELFGPNATVTDVEVDETWVHFCLPASDVQDFPSPVKLTIYGIHDGKLECSLILCELAEQIRFKDFITVSFPKIIKQAKERGETL
ncbi:hypothetical protein GGR92_000023 [Spirosoma lacussanchae]|uniref:hypothetical protein n=1 Tax=Spirosoma lacussanchae TaxID=1884249 RepID=UPI001108D3E1|nr:hypothetical protein [Spirosoma lacussanchae]